MIRFRQALKALLSASNPFGSGQYDNDNTSTDCCICIGSIAPFQAIFIAPCSHCFHYKCVGTLLVKTTMFQCPLCRQVANLAASVSTDSLFNQEEHVSHESSNSDEGSLDSSSRLEYNHHHSRNSLSSPPNPSNHNSSYHVPPHVDNTETGNHHASLDSSSTSDHNLITASARHVNPSTSLSVSLSSSPSQYDNASLHNSMPQTSPTSKSKRSSYQGNNNTGATPLKTIHVSDTGNIRSIFGDMFKRKGKEHQQQQQQSPQLSVGSSSSSQSHIQPSDKDHSE